MGCLMSMEPVEVVVRRSRNYFVVFVSSEVSAADDSADALSIKHILFPLPFPHNLFLLLLLLMMVVMMVMVVMVVW